VRPGAHIGDAQRCFAYQRRASGRKANPRHSRALGPKQLSVSLAPPASWQSRHVPTFKFLTVRDLASRRSAGCDR
jgi:hypothetical protein